MNKRNIFFWCVLILVFAFSALLIVEVYVRIAKGALVNTDLLRGRLKGSSIKGIVKPASNAEIFFELKAGLRTTFQNKTVVTGEGGYRISANEQSPARDGAVRIALLGDSTSFGWGVDFEDTYIEVVRREMEAIFARPVEVRNYSVPGYNSKQEYYTFLEKVEPYKPDLLIVHHDHNDTDPTGLLFGTNYLPPQYGDNFLHSALLKLLLREIRSRRYKDNFTFKEGSHKLLRGYIINGPLL